MKLHRSPGSVAHDVRRARLLHGPLAPVHAELAAGHLTAAHVAPICEQAERMQATPLGEIAAADAAFTTRAEIQVLVDARVLAGTDGAAWVQVEHGDPVAVGRDDLLDLITDTSVPTVFRRLLVDPATGALVDRGARTYQATDDLIAWLGARDITCRFPGCTTRARRCDIDHATDFADGGRTTIENTGLLCRRLAGRGNASSPRPSHNRKTHGGWRIENTHPDGSCTFIAPDGTRHRHLPTSLADLMAHPPDQRPALPQPRAPLPPPEDDPAPSRVADDNRPGVCR